MPKHSYNEVLKKAVGETLKRYEIETFGSVWKTSQEVIGDLSVLGFYLSVKDGYANVAIVTKYLLVDIEAEDETEDEEPTSHFNILRLSSLSGIEFHETPVKDVPGSEDAKLVLIAYVAGSEVIERYWLAHTTDEQHRLLHFGKILLQSLKVPA